MEDVMRGRYIVLVVILLLAALQVSAKGQANRIVLTGPTIEGEMVLTQPLLTSVLSMGSLEDFMTGEIAEPADKGETYFDLERQFEISANQIATIDRVRFYPGDDAQPGYVYYLGLENGSSEYDKEWFFAKPEATEAFNTAFNPDAQPYVVLMPDNGHLLMADPTSLEDVADIALFTFDTRIDEVMDGPDAATLYINTHDAGYTQHYRVNLSEKTVCWAEVLPPAVSQPASLMWSAGMIAQELSAAMPGTWVEPIAENDQQALLYHPLGRYHNYDYGAEDRGEIPGGILVYSHSNQQRDHWQADKGFAQVIAGEGVLYAIEAPRGEDRVELYVLDATNGEILTSRVLDEGRWSIGYSVLDLSGLAAQTRLASPDRCPLNSWEIPQVWRLPQTLVASS
jgi:hypothetical protein